MRDMLFDLRHFDSMRTKIDVWLHFYTPWKYQKTLKFSGCNRTWNLNHLVHKQILNRTAKIETKLLWVWVLLQNLIFRYHACSESKEVLDNYAIAECRFTLSTYVIWKKYANLDVFWGYRNLTLEKKVMNDKYRGAQC